MKKAKCKHYKAFPWGYKMWCPDCGAIRTITHSNKTNGFYFNSNHWVYPRGHENVCKQLNKLKYTNEK